LIEELVVLVVNSTERLATLLETELTVILPRFQVTG
jgi:hypothetical protein